MTKVGVIGYGVVGKATAEVLQRLGHEVAVWDADGARLAQVREDGYGFLRRDRSPDILFLCVFSASQRPTSGQHWKPRRASQSQSFAPPCPPAPPTVCRASWVASWPSSPRH